MRKQMLLWGLVLGTALLLSRLAAIGGINVAVARALEPVGRAWPWLELVWVAGSLPVTAFLIFLATRIRSAYRGARWTLWAGFLGGTLVEVALKHWWPLPLPHALPTPLPYRLWISDLNIEPSQLTALFPVLAHHAHGRLGSGLFHGSFPSGHVFRLTFTAGAWTVGRRPVWIAAVGIVAAVAVTATGGHWVWDTVGGFALARLALAGALSWRRR